MVAPGVEELHLVDRARAEHLRHLAFDEFAGQHVALLLADRHPLARLDELGDVPFRRVKRHAAHRRFLAARQRDVEDRTGDDRVLVEQLVKIAQPEEQQHVGGQALPDAQVLAHHRRGRGEWFGWRFGRQAVRVSVPTSGRKPDLSGIQALAGRCCCFSKRLSS